MFGIGCVGAFEITTRSQKYPSRTMPSSRRIASGMPSDTANPKGVKTPQHDKVWDESWGKVYSHEYPHCCFNVTGLSNKCQNLSVWMSVVLWLNNIIINWVISENILIPSRSILSCLVVLSTRRPQQILNIPVCTESRCWPPCLQAAGRGVALRLLAYGSNHWQSRGEAPSPSWRMMSWTATSVCYLSPFQMFAHPHPVRVWGLVTSLLCFQSRR